MKTVLRAPLILAGLLLAPLPALSQSDLLSPTPLGGGDNQLQRTQPRETSASAPAPRTGVAGRYAPLREGKDTGCMITLDANARGPSGANKAQLAPACRDQGLVIFDPVGWQVVGGRLALTARKGHKAHFDRQGDGTWLRDPKEGKSLSLRPI